MMGRSHIATGTVTGGSVLAAITGLGLWLVPGFTHLGPSPWLSGLIIAAGASLLPDLDTNQSTAYHALGPVSNTLGDLSQTLSRWAYLRSAGPADSPTPRVHRGLLHTPAFAVLVGLVQALTFLVSPWTAAPLVFFCSVLTLKGLHQSLPWGWVKTLYPIPPLRGVFQGAYSAGATAALIGLGQWHWSAGIYLGLCLALGMITHDLGDACTNSAVPMLWPKLRAGKRWTCSGVPKAVRFNAGDPIENTIRRLSLTLSVLLIAAAAVLPVAWPHLVVWVSGNPT